MDVVHGNGTTLCKIQAYELNIKTHELGMGERNPTCTLNMTGLRYFPLIGSIYLFVFLQVT